MIVKSVCLWVGVVYSISRGGKIEIKRVNPPCVAERKRGGAGKKGREKNCWNRKNTVPQLLLSCKINNQTRVEKEGESEEAPSLPSTCRSSSRV